MSYPPDPLEHMVELYLAGSWRDVTEDVLGDNGIAIRRGRSDNSTSPAPGTCNFILNNSSWDYSPRWPTGQWYGYIGRNTPLRVGLVTARDAFGRTVSGGWGSTDTSQAWTSGGVGGSVLASDHNVGSGVGTQSIPAVSSYRYDYLATVTQASVDVMADMTLSFTNVTGGDIYPCGIMLRGQSSSSYYLVRVGITTAEAVTIGVFLADGTTVLAAVTVAGLTHVNTQTLRIRAQTEGQTIRGKVWAATGSEPYGWHITVHDTTITTAGFVGIRSGLSAGNSNALPVIVSVDNVKVKELLFSGEISDMPAGWDISGNFVTATVIAGGPLRRLAQEAALQSALRRGYLRDLEHPPLVYWPCEETGSVSYFASAINTVPLWIVNAIPEFASLTPFDCSDALPGVNLSTWWGQIPQHTPGRCQVRFLVSIPSGGLGLGLRRLMVVALTGGSVAQFSIFADQSGNLSVIAYDTNLTALYNSGSVAAGLNGVPQQVALEWEQTTATNVNLNLIALTPGAAAVVEIGVSGANIVGSQTCGFATALIVDPDILLPDTVAIGHISFHTTSQTLLNLSSQLNAWKGETAAARVIRLGTEERLPVSYVGTLADSMPMGPQRVLSLLKLLYECVSADFGELYESRGEPGLTYRTRTDLYNQVAAITLDYSLGQLSELLVSTDDDRYLKNDVTVTREGGGSARRVLETGRLSILPPELGGSGRYDLTATVNVYSNDLLDGIAGWLLHLGTVDEARYPVVNLDMANAHLVAAGLQDTAMDLEIGSRLVITNPKSGQAVDDISQLITGYEMLLKRYIFTIKYNCVPESPYQVGVLDDTDKRLDTEDSELTSDISTVDASFQVTTNSGDLWTLDAGDLPLDIKIGGELMTVGAISGATSPQTFSSVTRSVNGVVKSHSAGTLVNVAYPFVLPL